MKLQMILLAATLMASVSQAQAKTHTLTCLNTYSHSEKPFMTAEIVSDTTIRNVKFEIDPDSGLQDDIKNVPYVLTGTMVVSHHSPYQGDIQYSLPGGQVLLLPASLVNDDLQATYADGIGYQKNENGVIIGSYSGGDSDGGNHFSVRLNCSSDK